RQLRRADEVLQVHEPPPAHLRAVGEVEVLGERVVLPASRVFDRRAPPHAGGAVEVEEAAGTAASSVLEDEMAVEKHGLPLREEGVLAVDVAPAHLNEADLRVLELADRLLQDVGGGHEVGVEDEHELAGGGGETGVGGPRLVSG